MPSSCIEVRIGTCSLIGISRKSPDAAGHEYELRLTPGQPRVSVQPAPASVHPSFCRWRCRQGLKGRNLSQPHWASVKVLAQPPLVAIQSAHHGILQAPNSVQHAHKTRVSPFAKVQIAPPTEEIGRTTSLPKAPKYELCAGRVVHCHRWSHV